MHSSTLTPTSLRTSADLASPTLQPVVDLIVPAYGDSPFLAECLRSLQRQGLAGCRVLVVTSTPSKFIDDVAKGAGVPVRISPRPPGIASDWNFALECATSSFVTICHQDDIYREDYCESMFATMQASSDVLIALCGNTEHTETGPRRIKLNLRIKRYLLARAFGAHSISDARSIRRKLLSLGNPVCCPGVMFNRALLNDFRFSDTLKSNLDWDAWDRICSLEGSVAYVREAMVSHRVHATSETSASIAGNVRFEEDFAMFRRYWPEPMCRVIMSVYKLSYIGNRG